MGPVSIHSIAARANSDRMSRPKTEVGKFQGVELTSIINMIDLEGGTNIGSQPLVDLDVGPKLDSGPRLLDSGPAMMQDSTVIGVAPPRNPYAPPMPMQPMPMMQPGPRPGTPEPLAPHQMLAVGQRRSSTQGPRGERAGTMTRRRRSPIRAWMVIVAILVAAAVATMIVAMSGPDVPASQGK
jgi:hypothetical protein